MACAIPKRSRFDSFLSPETEDTDSMNSSPATSPKPARRRNRQTTEAAILQAFTTVVERDGLAAANPTSIMAESGYSKPLLYDYFGDMNGLVSAWFERNHIWPDYNFPEVIENSTQLKQCLKHFLLTTANALRNNICAQEFLAAELTRNFEYQEMLEKSRERWFRENMNTLLAHPEIREADNWNLMFVVYNAVNYLVLRAHAGTSHVGLQMGTDEGWADAIARTEQVIDDLILLHQLRGTALK